MLGDPRTVAVLRGLQKRGDDARHWPQNVPQSQGHAEYATPS
ncbi:hypothetical protein [Candidatus Nitrosocosmicus oleophilus]|nr:hypothetical protein [Candidatus Nitrosocosmicus oleophilus]